jgi:predicted Rossmann fold flavoprotein
MAQSSINKFDVIVVGAGAAGLMCAIEAGARGRSVLVLEKSNKVGKKILMSGGGRCNFTNLNISPECYLSHNKHFCISALKRYTQWDFIAKVAQHKIAYYEKTLGQLFCVDKASKIVEMLLTECAQRKVTILLNQAITAITKYDGGFKVNVDGKVYSSASLVIASGGLSIPTLGSSPFGYQIAAQFGLALYPTRAGLVPVTLHTHDKTLLEPLSGIDAVCEVSCNNQAFMEQMLFTHRGLSGPAILQISSFWQPGDALNIKLEPDIDLYEVLITAQKQAGDSHLKTILANYFAKRLLAVFIAAELLDKPLKRLERHELQSIADFLQNWTIKPNGTEGYRTAEVTLGGVDCDEISSQTFEAKKVPGLYFIGEVLDVTGWLGGYNFQWAWSSGWAAGQVV